MVRYLYSTIHRGKVKVKSRKQHRFLHVHRMPHTHVYSTGRGRKYRKRVR